MKYLERNVTDIRARIAAAASASGRNPEDVTLLAAVKSGEIEEIRYLHRELGICDLGENRVQQFLEHYAALEGESGIRWHFIGSLQTNKVKYLIDKVCMIHSLDSLRLAAEIEKQAAKREIVMDVLVEINSGAEESKGGILLDEAEDFCLALREFPHIRLRGFMTMAPKCENSAQYCEYFEETSRRVLDIWRKKLHNIIESPLLSMGMSDSFEAAIACGSTMVRVGRGLFVGRDTNQ
jgi:pyridoxal phosphate enzyme (YggS family)